MRTRSKHWPDVDRQNQLSELTPFFSIFSFFQGDLVRGTLLMFFLVRLLLNLFGDVQHTLVERDRERHSKLPRWRPETRQEAEEAAEDEEALEEAEMYERSRQWKKALAI